MLKIMKNIILLFLLALTSNISLAIDKIEIYSPNNNAFSSTYEFKTPLNENIDSYLKLGDNIDAQVIKITSSTTSKFKVSVQFETSLTIMDEGPHIDLTEWKHCTTDWVDLKSVKPNEYILPKSTKIDGTCFPKVSDEEIRSEVRLVAGGRWSSLLKGDIDVNNYPLGVSLSAMRIRIQEEINGMWRLVTTINFNIPMGC
jgi:hypothetical protein